jgi:hypothetical protein
MGHNRFPRLVYTTPCLPLNFWVVLLLLFLVLGLILHYDHVPVYCCLIIVHDKIIVLIGTWSLLEKHVLPQGWNGTPLVD